jgi:hypothetical protein
MRRLRFFIALIILGFSSYVFAQITSREYNQAASAYQNGNFAEAEKLWIDLADQGDADAQYALGIMHLKKEAQQSEDAIAFRYLVEAAKKQHVASMFNLGVAYWEGRGVSRQTEKALNWWEVAAQRDDAGAQYNLGLAYYIGEGRAQSTPKAIYWVQQAANNGHPQARALLVTMQDKSTATSNAEDKNAEDKPVESETRQQATSVAPESSQEKGSQAAVASNAESDSRIHLSNKTTVLHAAANMDSAQVYTLKAGVSVRAIQTSGDWTQILVSRSYPVWVYETFLEDLGNGKGKIKGSNVNIRPSTSTNNQTSPPLGQLSEGQRVSIIVKRGPWVQVMPPEPFPAWVITSDIQE